MEEENNNIEEPIISDEEMKMPEEDIGMSEPQKSSHLSAILGVLIIVLVLILVGLYLWGTTFNTPAEVPEAAAERPTIEQNNEPESTNAEADVETAQAVSTSDEIEAIEADIESTDIEELDAELNAIDAELDAALENI